MGNGFEGTCQSVMHSGTAPDDNTPTKLNARCTTPVVTSEQPQYLTAVDPITEQPPSSSAGSEPAVSDAKVPSISVSVRKKGRYEAHDKVDRYLLLQVCRHVRADSLELLAEYLGVSEEQYVDTRTQTANLTAQVMNVSTP